MSNDLNPILKKRVEKYFFDQGKEKVEIEPLDTNNLLSTISKITVNEDERYILKSAHSSDAIRKYAQVDKLFKKETYAYDILFRHYNDLMVEHEITKSFAAIPKIYFTCNETFQECLVMDDMTGFGFKNWNVGTALDSSHVALVMKTYGKLHALSYAFREYRNIEYKKCAEYVKDKFNTSTNTNQLNEQHKSGCRRILEFLNPAKDKRAIQLFKKFAERPYEYQMEAIKMGTMGAYPVISHGDAVLNNLMFKYADTERPEIPTDICLLDWQFCRYGSPAFDLSQFLFIFTDREFRKNYYLKMIKAYYYSLCSFLTEFGLDAEKILPFDILLLQLKRFSIFGLCTATMKGHILLGGEDEVKHWSENTKVSDINATFDENAKICEVYKSRMRDMIYDFVEYGYFEFLN